jgi:hypothetical protein
MVSFKTKFKLEDKFLNMANRLLTFIFHILNSTQNIFLKQMRGETLHLEDKVGEPQVDGTCLPKPIS